ncbi:MAG: hypothetical protein ACP5SB_03305 [Caldisericaceae bacterium]
MKNKILTAVFIALLIILCAFLALLLTVKKYSITSVNARVIGESIVGENYNKSLDILLHDNKYYLTYKCSSKEPGKYCKCLDSTKLITRNELGMLMKEINALKDEGESAKCCDHPWTEIEVHYSNGAVRKLTVAMEPINFETLLNITCP